MNFKILLFILILSSVSVHADLTDDLEAYYKFDGNLSDSVGSADLTGVGIAYNDTYGILNGGYKYTYRSSNQAYGLASDNPFSNGDSEFTISLWYKPTTTALIVPFSMRASTYSMIIYNANTEVYFTLSTSGGLGSLVTTSSPITINAWNNVIFTYKNGNGLKCYVDGSLVLTDTTRTGTLVIGATENLRFGKNGASSSSQAFGGYIDDSGFWSRELNSSEVSEIYNSGTGLQYPFSTSTGWSGNYIGMTDLSYYNGISEIDNIIGVV